MQLDPDEFEKPEFKSNPDILTIPIAIPFSYNLAKRFNRIKNALSLRDRSRPKSERKINEYCRKALIEMMDRVEPELISEGLLKKDKSV